MAESFKLFVTIGEEYRLLGVTAYEPNRKWPTFLKRSFFILSMGVYCVVSIIFVVIEAKSVQELGDCFYIIATLLACGSIYVQLIWLTPMIEAVTEKFSAFFRESKLNFESKRN